jgi:hypothetical protein
VAPGQFTKSRPLPSCDDTASLFRYTWGASIPADIATETPVPELSFDEMQAALVVHKLNGPEAFVALMEPHLRAGIVRHIERQLQGRYTVTLTPRF